MISNNLRIDTVVYQCPICDEDVISFSYDEYHAKQLAGTLTAEVEAAYNIHNADTHS